MGEIFIHPFLSKGCEKMPNYVKNLINMDYNTIVELSKRENIGSLKSVVTSMANTANRRINTLLKDPIGQYSPAYKILTESGTNKFSIKKIDDMNSTQLVEEYNTLKRFLKAKTSTLRGWKTVRKAIGKRTGARKLFATERKSSRSAKLWINREKRFWSLYNKLVDNYGGIISQLNSNQIQEVLSKIQLRRNQARTDEDISKAITVYVDSIYRDSHFDESKFLDALKDENYMEEVRIAYDKLG